MPNHLEAEAVDHIIAAAKRRQAYVNAHTRMVNQVRALCRAECYRAEAEKKDIVDDADALYDAFRKGTGHPRLVLFMSKFSAFRELLEKLETVQEECELGDVREIKPNGRAVRRPNGVVHRVRLLDPRVYKWAMEQRGLGEIGLGNALMITRELERYPTVSKLWFWCGLGLVTYDDGQRERQRRYKDPVMAARHRYVQEKRKEFYLIATNFVRSGHPRYRELYDRAKARFQAEGKSQTPPTKGKEGDRHAHLHALRIVAKRFLADFWEVWNPELVKEHVLPETMLRRKRTDTHSAPAHSSHRLPVAPRSHAPHGR